MMHFVVLVCVLVVIYPFFRARSLWSESGGHRRNKDAYVLVVSVLLIALLGFRRLDVGIDTYAYFTMFTESRFQSWAHLLGRVETGYAFLEMLISKALGNFHVFNMLVAILYVGAVSRHIKRHSSHPMVSYLFFVLFGYYSFCLLYTSPSPRDA